MNSFGRFALFVDGPSLHTSARALGMEIDFRRLLQHFGQLGSLVRAHYYAPPGLSGEPNSVRHLLDWLDYNGFTVIAKPVRDAGRNPVATDLAIDAMAIAGRLDQIVLFAGDADYRSLVIALQKKGKRVLVVSSAQARRCGVAPELRRQADGFVELANLADVITRRPVQG